MFIRHVEFMDGNNRVFSQAPTTWAKAMHWVPSSVAVWRRFQDICVRVTARDIICLSCRDWQPSPVSQPVFDCYNQRRHTRDLKLEWNVKNSKMCLVRFCSRFYVQPLTKLRWFKIDGRIFAFSGSYCILWSSRWNLVVISIAIPVCQSRSTPFCSDSQLYSQLVSTHFRTVLS
jgi:hypothetical protein